MSTNLTINRTFSASSVPMGGGLTVFYEIINTGGGTITLGGFSDMTGISQLTNFATPSAFPTAGTTTVTGGATAPGVYNGFVNPVDLLFAAPLMMLINNSSVKFQMPATATGLAGAHGSPWTGVTISVSSGTLGVLTLVSESLTITAPHPPGVEFDYVVPANVECVLIQCWGAQGASGSNAVGGMGGYVQAVFGVTPGDTLKVLEGAAGIGTLGGAGFGNVNGGAGSTLGPFTGGGGGAGSYVRPTSVIFPVPGTDGCYIVSGGGGGGSLNLGGTGGGDPAGDGALSGLTGGSGASGSSTGAGGTGGGNPGINGNGGAGSSPGAGGGGGRRGGGGGDNQGGGGGGGNGFINLSLHQPDSMFPEINANFGQPGYVTLGDINGRVIITPVICPCVAEGTLVRAASGKQTPIEQLREGDLIQDSRFQLVSIQSVIRFRVPSKCFISIRASSFGPSVPEHDLLIRQGHPLFLAGREVLPEQLLDEPGVERVSLEEATFIYTLITDRRCFINMQGLMVGTWSEAAWENQIENDERLIAGFDRY